MLPEILLMYPCLYIVLFIYHLCQYSKLNCLSLHLILDCQSETVFLLDTFFWDRVWDNADSFPIPISYPHCCRMPNSVRSPLQSQPALDEGSPLVATSNDSYLSRALSLQIPDWAKQVTSAKSICFCWPYVEWGTTVLSHSHDTHWRHCLKARTMWSGYKAA